MGSVLSVIGYVPSIMSATYVLMEYWFQSVVMKRPVSFPGHPLKNKLTRRGKWVDKETRLASGWKFAHDFDSYNVSKKNYPNGEILGDSAGRQIWYIDNTVPKEKDDVSPPFNPSKNPN
eukprot:gene40057-52902_t